MQSKRKDIPSFCLNDGHPFKGFIYQFPTMEHPLTKKWIFDKRIFCHGACMKCWLRRDITRTQTHIANAELYLVRDLGIINCPTAPDPCIMAVFNSSGEGLTIEEYRDFETSQNLIEKPDSDPINRNVFINGPQINNEIPFEQLIRENHTLGLNSLYRRHEMETDTKQEEYDEEMLAKIPIEEEEEFINQ